MVKIIFIFFVSFIFFNESIFSQVTVREIGKRIDTIAEKPPIYDSLKDFEEKEKFIDYKQYVGLDIYIPNFSSQSGEIFHNNQLFSKAPTNLQTTVPKTDNIGQKIGNYNSILTYVYKPVVYASGIANGNGYAYISSDANQVRDKYFKILDVFYEDQLKLIIDTMNKILHNAMRQNIYSNYYDEFRSGEMPRIAFLIKNNSTGETLYLMIGYNRGCHFILVPYFIKQKELYDGRKFVALVNEGNNNELNEAYSNKNIKIKPLSKWTCEVSVLKDYNYSIVYILKNDSNQTVIKKSLIDINSNTPNYNPNIKFVLESDYLIKEKEKQLKQSELIANREKEKKEQEEEQIKVKESHRQYCVTKFGNTNGELIAQGKVTIRMTMEMCKVAWGNPYNTNKITVEKGVFEDWYYGWGKSLHFENGILNRIEE